MARFKKGSPAAKAWGRKMKRLRSGSSTRKTTSSKTKFKRKRTMAKRKTKKRTSKRGGSLFGISMGKAMSSVLYGAIRARTSRWISPWTAKLPLGSVADEAGMIGLSVLAKRYMFKKAGLVRDALSAGQTIELARIGDAAASGNLKIPFLNMGGASAAAPNGSNIF